MSVFKLHAPFAPAGDQPQAIARLTALLGGARPVGPATLLGVTGSGKTYTMAHLVANLGLPTLVITHNKTLAAQLFQEFREFFPENAVEYFVSYYDYYQPEAYIPHKDLFIEKDASINEKIDRLRHSATRALLERPDTLVVASVSCIYGLGNPEHYRAANLKVERGGRLAREAILEKLVDMQYKRTNLDLARNYFRCQGDVIEVWSAYAEEVVRIELFGDEVERITELDPASMRTLRDLPRCTVYPAQHYVLPEKEREAAFAAIEAELEERARWFKARDRLLELQRITERTRYDLELMREVGYCSGIENYSRHLDGRKPGEPPHTLLDYFPEDFLLLVDESHMTLPQLRGMLHGDRARKENLVEHGFRLPSAFDNRPLEFSEFEKYMRRTLFVSATPAEEELARSKGRVVEQIIRPTGLVDPRITVRPAEGQVDDLIARIRERVARHERVLVTTLTKRMAEDLSRYLAEFGFAVAYLHSEIETLERTEILRDLRTKKYDVLVGINLLREGLDLPEVSLVAILDADKEGFLRSARSLIQTTGRASRHVNGEVILYADTMTDSIKATVAETERRRALQLAHNAEHGITPRSVVKSIQDLVIAGEKSELSEEEKAEFAERTADLEARMRKAAEDLDFETAAKLRDELLRFGVEFGKRRTFRPKQHAKPKKRFK